MAWFNGLSFVCSFSLLYFLSIADCKSITIRRKENPTLIRHINRIHDKILSKREIPYRDDALDEEFYPSDEHLEYADDVHQQLVDKDEDEGETESNAEESGQESGQVENDSADVLDALNNDHEKEADETEDEPESENESEESGEAETEPAKSDKKSDAPSESGASETEEVDKDSKHENENDNPKIHAKCKKTKKYRVPLKGHKKTNDTAR